MDARAHRPVTTTLLLHPQIDSEYLPGTSLYTICVAVCVGGCCSDRQSVLQCIDARSRLLLHLQTDSEYPSGYDQ